MAVLAIVTSSPAAVEGGHLTIARALVAAAAENGHTAHLVVTPDYGFGRQTASYWASRVCQVVAASRSSVRALKIRCMDCLPALRLVSDRV